MGLVSAGARPARAADLGQYLAPDFCGVIVVHPQRIGQSTLAEAIKTGLPKAIVNADPVDAIAASMKKSLNKGKDLPPGMDVDKLASLLRGKPLKRIVVMIDAGLDKKGEPSSAVVAQFVDEIDTEGVLAAITTQWEPAETNGVKYKSSRIKAVRVGQWRVSARQPYADHRRRARS